MGQAAASLRRDAVRGHRPQEVVRGRREPRGRPHVRSGHAALRSFQEPDQAGDAGALRRTRQRGQPRRAHQADVHRRAHQQHRGPRRAAHRAAPPGRRRRQVHRGRTGHRQGCARDPRAHVRVRGEGPFRRMEGRDRQGDRNRRQHRHRWLRPGSRHGVRGAQAVRRRRHQGPLRFQHRPQRHRREDPRPGPGDHAVRRRLQDLRHPRDPDQRP